MAEWRKQDSGGRGSYSIWRILLHCSFNISAAHLLFPDFFLPAAKEGMFSSMLILFVSAGLLVLQQIHMTNCCKTLVFLKRRHES